MQYNLYKFDDKGNLAVEPFSSLSEDILQSIKVVENQIVKEFLEKQQNKLGIKNLGNELRYNKIISNEFENSNNENFVLVKMTENKRSFLKVFLTSINKYNNKEIYFWILERDFGIISQIVDSTFPDIYDIKDYMNLLRENFSPKSNLSINVIEMCGFENYIVSNQNNYSRLVFKN